METSRQNVRRAMQRQRQQLPAATREQASISISHHIANSPWFLRSRHIAFYWAVRNEIDAFPLLQQAWLMGKTCYLPVCHPVNKQTLLFLPYHQGEALAYNRYGILEPVIKNLALARKPYSLDLVLTPLVAFDDHGNRIGSGKAYYDRTFAYLNHRQHLHKPSLVGLAYQFQQTQAISPQPWDVALDKIVIYDIAQQLVQELAAPLRFSMLQSN